MTPDEERPGVHAPGPSMSRSCELNAVNATPTMCAVCGVARAEWLHVTWSLCRSCHPAWWDGVRLRRAEAERRERERTVGYGRPVVTADGHGPGMWRLQCDRCSRAWVGPDGEVCAACFKFRGDSAADPVQR